MADQPVVAERVADRAGPFPVELVPGFPDQSPACRDRFVDDRVGVIDVQVDDEGPEESIREYSSITSSENEPETDRATVGARPSGRDVRSYYVTNLA